MTKYYFITGTDTGIGKTTAGINLLKKFNEQGLSTIGLKPLASGCNMTTEGLRNDDALQLQQNASIYLPYKQVNPIAFLPPIAPHIAAQQMNIALSSKMLLEACENSFAISSDICLIEGAGGWYTPLNENETYADWVKLLNIDVILVVGIRLGCFNHAILTYRAIKNDRINCIGWIANCLENANESNRAIITSLNKILDIPLIGTIDNKRKLATIRKL